MGPETGLLPRNYLGPESGERDCSESDWDSLPGGEQSESITLPHPSDAGIIILAHPSDADHNNTL